MLVQPLTAGFFLEPANPVLWLSYASFFFFFFAPMILLKAWGGGGALVLILVLPCQECCSLCAFPPRALSGTLEPQDHFGVPSCQKGAWPMGQAFPAAAHDQELHPSSSPACSLGLMPSLTGSRTGGDKQQSPSETPTPVSCSSRPPRAVFLLSLLSLETAWRRL